MPAEHVIHEGDSSSRCSSKRGTVHAYIGRGSVVLAVMTDAGYFGEVALLKGCRRARPPQSASHHAIMYDCTRPMYAC